MAPCELILSEQFYGAPTHRLITEQYIHVGQNLHEVILEKLADEGCREVQAKQLVIIRGMLRHFQDGLHRDCQEETLEANSDLES